MPRGGIVAGVLALVLFVAGAGWLAAFPLPAKMSSLTSAGLPRTFYAKGDQTESDALRIQQMAADDTRTVLVLGSSELDVRHDPFMPNRVLTDSSNGFVPFLIGQGGSQSIIQALQVAALGRHLRNRPIVLLVSPQWFVPGGMSEYLFDNNWNVQKTYEAAFSSGLSPQLTRRLARRLLEFHNVERDPVLWVGLQGLAMGGTGGRIVSDIVSPLVRFDLWALRIQDTFMAFGQLLRAGHSASIHSAGTPAATLSQPNWNVLTARAEQLSRTRSSSDTYGIDNGVWARIGASSAYWRKSHPADSYAHSPEYADIGLLLDVLRQLHARPLIVILPVKGAWYDHVGFTFAQRSPVYSRVSQMARSHGFAVADFSGSEYDRYFLSDPSHVGPKGWVRIDEAIASFVGTGTGGAR